MLIVHIIVSFLRLSGVAGGGHIASATSPVDIWRDESVSDIQGKLESDRRTDIFTSLKLGVFLSRKDFESVRTKVITLHIHNKL